MTSTQSDAGALGTTAPAAPGYVDPPPNADHGDAAAPSVQLPPASVRLGVHAILIDDNEDDRRIADRLTEDGLPCLSLAPTGSLEELRATISSCLSKSESNVVLLDYRLDDRRPEDGEPFAHRAGALAADLKEHFPGLPLVLLTTEANLQEWVEGNRSIAPLFDLTVLKSSLAEGASRHHYAAGISDLAYGYDQLVGLAKSDLSWEAIAAGLGLDEHEAATFAADWPDPPPKGLPDLVAAVLKGMMADRPGLLLPYVDAAARLGILPKSLPDVLQAAPYLRYEGPFCLLGPRIWRARLDATLVDVDATFREGASIEEGLASTLRAAPEQLCRVCSELRSTRACAVCHQGVDERHFVLASEMLKPAWSDPRAVCFVCIENGSAEDERFPAASRGLVTRLRDGEGWGG